MVNKTDDLQQFMSQDLAKVMEGGQRAGRQTRVTTLMGKLDGDMVSSIANPTATDDIANFPVPVPGLVVSYSANNPRLLLTKLLRVLKKYDEPTWQAFHDHHPELTQEGLWENKSLVDKLTADTYHALDAVAPEGTIFGVQGVAVGWFPVHPSLKG